MVREVFEETGLRVAPERLAYIDELIDNDGRMIKLWYIVRIVGGEVSLGGNPVGEGIVEARWFRKEDLPTEPLFPPVLRDGFWDDLKDGFDHPRKLPLTVSYY